MIKVLIALIFISCASVKNGKYVYLNSISDLSQIAKNHNVSIDKIKDYNSNIKPGAWIFLPGKGAVLSDNRIVKNNNDMNFLWPLKNHRHITSYYGKRGRKLHAGIDIRAPRGTEIISAMSGKVLFSGWMRGYGKVTIIRHSNLFHTVYAHASKNLKSKGDWVDRGEVIAKVGSTGRSTGNHLHFEIRINDRPTNPMKYFGKQLAKL